MWITLFTITFAVAICLSVTAILLQPTRQSPSSHRKNVRSIIAEFAQRCQALSRIACVGCEAKRFGARDATNPTLSANMADTRLLGRRTSSLQDAPVPLRRMKAPADVGLLLRRMAVLNIDPNEVDSADPLLFRELQGLCTLCQSKEPCACDLAHNAADAGFRDWRQYCPNAATLSLLSRTDQARSSRIYSPRLHRPLI
jgi:hypothetical protein